MRTRQVPLENSEDFDILSAIWILSCNDEISNMTCQGIKYRLGLPDSYDVRSLVKSRGELFRSKIPGRRLDIWKREMLEGNRLPSWIRDMEKETDQKTAIETLNSEDVFRNQFRTEANSPRSQMEIIKWGLEHIERLRKATLEARDEKTKRWKDVWIPFISTGVAFLSTVIAVTALVISSYLQLKSINTQKELQDRALGSQEKLKYYEVELEPKRAGYASFMKLLNESYENASRHDEKALADSLYKAEITYYELEPFLINSEMDMRLNVWSKFKEISNMCKELKDLPNEYETQIEYRRAFTVRKDELRTVMYSALFPQS